MPTCLSHQSTQKINHPLPTHTVAMLWGSCSSQSPSQGSGGSCWDLPGLLGFSRVVAGCSESRWTSHRGCPCSQPFSLLSSSRAGERTSPPGTQPLFSGGDGALGLKFPSGAGEVTGPFNHLQSPSSVCPRGFGHAIECPVSPEVQFSHGPSRVLTPCPKTASLASHLFYSFDLKHTCTRHASLPALITW